MPLPMLSWEAVQSSNAGNAPAFPTNVSRARVPGGWLVYSEEEVEDEKGWNALAFVPDSKHEWGAAY